MAPKAILSGKRGNFLGWQNYEVVHKMAEDTRIFYPSIFCHPFSTILVNVLLNNVENNNKMSFTE